MVPIRNSAKALIIRDGCVLTMKMRDEEGVYFILPGGRQEPGETLADTVRRECYEELSAEVIVHDLRFIREHTREVPHRVEFIFRCTLKSEVGTATGSHPDDGQLGYTWLPLQQLRHTRFYPLGLRPLLDGTVQEDCPAYLGDLP
jgi:8-oxo-dGTP pyrophosphatase MutT (NUDIX family)